MGIPVEYQNETELFIEFTVKGKAEVMETASIKQSDYVSTEFYFVETIPIDFDYQVKEEFIKYISMGDIFATLGGVSASIGVIFGQLSVLMIISFYCSLSSLVHNFNSLDYHMFVISSARP